MDNQEINYEKPEEELGSTSQLFQIPIIIKWLISVVSIILLIGSVYLFCLYIEKPKVYASPSELGLVSIFIFSLTTLFLVWLPWGKMGIKISKIGGVEFQQIVATQASEHAEEAGYLEDRIEVLEERIHKLDKMSAITEQFEEPKLRVMLTDFLTKYNEWAFSPSRIKAWGSKQQGFYELVNYELPFVRSTLQKMVSEKLLETRISKKGNTLYRVPKC